MSAPNKTQPHKGWNSRGFHWHCDFPGLIQSIGIRLSDSVPKKVIANWKQELRSLTPSRRCDLLKARIDRYADMGYGCCYLSSLNIAQIVEDSLLIFDSQRYHLLSWCVMPNHLHALIVPFCGHRLSDITKNWKSYSAHEANRLLGRSGRFWFPDYYDRFMRSAQHMNDTIEYIENNPVTAKLITTAEQWIFSSANSKHRNLVSRNRLLYPEIDRNSLPDF